MKCAHCLTEFHDAPTETTIQRGDGALHEKGGTYWRVRARLCPACDRAIIELVSTHMALDPKTGIAIQAPKVYRVWPKGMARAPLSKEITDPYASDYREACLVLADSAKASAALSRRCLQNVLRDRAQVTPGNLYAEIDEVVKSGKLPPYLTELLLDAVRHFGNFAAHPEKDVATGEIIDVEPGEAEWCLDTIEALFDFYFVLPAKVDAHKAALDAKLKKAGKPPTT